MNIRKDINAFILYGLSNVFIDAAKFAFFGNNGYRFSACLQCVALSTLEFYHYIIKRLFRQNGL